MPIQQINTEEVKPLVENDQLTIVNTNIADVNVNEIELRPN